MAYYLVTAKPKKELLGELQSRLFRNEFIDMRPFGKALTASLQKAKWKDNDFAIWEEEDYCNPPLAEERAAVLDRYFDNLQVTPVEKGEGWKEIKGLPELFSKGMGEC